MDTSALAKWYLNEVFSDDVEAFLRERGQASISPLTVLEMRSLLARRKRAGDFGAELESRIFGVFQSDISGGILRVEELGADCYLHAVNLISSLPSHPLRSLDALHLSAAQQIRADEIATADRVMARAAEQLGFGVVLFAS